MSKGNQKENTPTHMPKGELFNLPVESPISNICQKCFQNKLTRYICIYAAYEKIAAYRI